jgi:urease accessory protein
VEALVDRAMVRTVGDLALFLAGRLSAGGSVQAAAAAAACALAGADAADWARWDGAVSARTPSAALRAASRAQGSALLRTVAAAWPGPVLDTLGNLPHVHHPLVLGVAVAAAGGTPSDAALLALHHLIGGAGSAAVRLLGLDPLAVAAAAVAAGRQAQQVAAAAAGDALRAVAADDPALLPAEGSALHDVLAQLHDTSGTMLFAS